ncbi:leucine-rich repeat-containing protein 72 [Lathamus discolor]|uniref:leucine-rich repeat-containing protein 72 n=1 Tax=Lathamus discolor TaxID=678569 RepID=UPI0032B724E5
MAAGPPRGSSGRGSGSAWGGLGRGKPRTCGSGCEPCRRLRSVGCGLRGCLPQRQGFLFSGEGVRCQRGRLAALCRPQAEGRTSTHLVLSHRYCYPDLLHNPLAQDPGYWLYVVHLFPSVQLLDRKSVTQRERESALHLYHYKRSGVMQSMAFGKRVDTLLETTVGSSKCTQPARRVMMPSGSEFGNQRNKEPFENPEDAILLRAVARSVMEFSYVDWNNVATSQERRLENKAAAEACKKLTVRFR